MPFNLPQMLATALAIATVSFVGGAVYGTTTTQTALHKVQADALAKSERELRELYQVQLDESDKAVRTLRQQKAAIAIQNAKLLKEINHVSDTDCFFSTGFVSVYNRAIAAPLSTDPVAAGADRTARTSAPLSASSIQQSDILHHITEYGGRCQALEAQLDALITYIETSNELRGSAGSSTRKSKPR